MEPTPHQPPPASSGGFALPIGLGALFLGLLWSLVGELMPADPLSLGATVRAPTPGYGRFLGAYVLFGGAAALCLALGASRLAARWGVSGEGNRLWEVWHRASDRRWLVYTSLAAFLLPALIRTWLLRGMPLTDDEGAYRFMAEVLASGRLWAESSPFALFFDRAFMINDGRWYAQYFLGWPAVLAPFARLGLAGFANSFFSALALPPIYLSLRHLLGSTWSRLGALLYLSSPMLMVVAATELSHTSCFAALAWLVWLALRCTSADASPWAFAAAATAFSVAFWIRPLSALGVGLPWLVLLGIAVARSPRKLAAGLAFGLPAALLAGLFLLANGAQNGSPTRTAYANYFEYSVSNDFRFSLYTEEPKPGAKEMEWVSPQRSLAMAAAGLWRLNGILFGWPISLFFLAFAGLGDQRGWIWASALCYLLSHLAVGNVGIDAFAPMHYIELGLPALLLTVLGVERATRMRALGWDSVLPLALVLASFVVALTSFVPGRVEALGRMVDEIERSYLAVEEIVETPAVVFTLEPFVAYCRHPPTAGWVHTRPTNSPNLDSPVIWANHLSLEADRLLMQLEFPHRRAYLLGWNQRCEINVVPLADLPPGSVADAAVNFDDTLRALGSAPARP